MGQSLEAFGQWKALVSFLFGCNKAVSTWLFCILLDNFFTLGSPLATTTTLLKCFMA